MTINRNTVVTFVAILAMMLVIGAVGCGGGKSDLAGDDTREIQDRKDPEYPDHFLPRPRKIGKRIDKSSPLLAAVPGGGFDQDLPSHRAFEIDGEAVLLPGASTRRGWDGTYKGRGVWSFAMYVVSPPEGTSDGDSSFVQVRVHALDDEGGVDFPSRGRRGNPLFQGGGNQGESPLYTALANFETDEWDWERHEYRPEGPTTLTRALEANHNTTRSRRCVLVVAVGPADFRDPDDDGDGIDSRFGGFGGAAARGGWRTVRGGGLRIHEVSRTSGARLQKRPDLLTSEWDELIDESLEMLSGAPGSVHLAFPTVRGGLNHVRCADGSCTSSTIPGTVGFGSSTSMAVGPDGLPVVCAVDFRGHVTVLKAADPGGGGDWSSTLAFEGDGDPSRFTTSMCITPEGEEIIAVHDYHDGNDLVLRKRPGRVKYGDITLKKGIVPTGSPVCVVDDAGTIFVAFRSSGGGEKGGAVHVFRCFGGEDDWEPVLSYGVPCPIGPDGSPAGVMSGDISPDGRLDIVCNTPDGDVMLSMGTRDGEFHFSRLGTPDTGSSSFSVQSCTEHTHVFAYCPGDGALRVYQKRKFNEEILEQRACVLPVGQDGVDEDCDGIYGFFGNGIDDDCDGTGEYRCYMLRSSRLTAPGAFSPRCWTLEVRVNRWEAA